MSECYIGTIVAWAPDYAPKGWLFCNGQTLTINQHEALYSLLGSTYGGDGKTTFMLPNLNGRVPVGAFMGGVVPPDVSTYPLGATGGNENATLTDQNMPMHTHNATTTTSGLTISNLSVQIPASSQVGDTNTPGTQASLAKAEDSNFGSANIYTTGNTDTFLKPAVVSGGTVSGTVTTTVSSAGTNPPTPIDIRQPYQAVCYIICVEGLYPVQP